MFYYEILFWGLKFLVLFWLNENVTLLRVLATILTASQKLGKYNIYYSAFWIKRLQSSNKLTQLSTPIYPTSKAKFIHLKTYEQLISSELGSTKVVSDPAACTCTKLLHSIGINYVQNFVHAELVDGHRTMDAIRRRFRRKCWQCCASEARRDATCAMITTTPARCINNSFNNT